MSTRPPRACIGAVMRFEAPYIVEWVAWHRILGFEIVIADNGGDDGQPLLLAKLDALGLITRIDVRGWSGNIQRRVYAMLFRWAQQQGVDTIGILDTDEFLEPMTIADQFDGSGAALVHDLFNNSQAAALAFNWMIFGDSHLPTGTLEPVVKRFVWAAERSFGGNALVKSFYHIKRCEAHVRTHLAFAQLTRVHVPNLPDRLMLHDGEPAVVRANAELRATPATTPEVSWRRARVRHYVIKTLDEYRTRKAGRDTKARLGEWADYNQQFLDHHNRNDVLAPLPVHALARLDHEIDEINGQLGKTAAVAIPDFVPYTRADLHNRWQSRPYLLGSCRALVRRLRRELGKATGQIKVEPKTPV